MVLMEEKAERGRMPTSNKPRWDFPLCIAPWVQKAEDIRLLYSYGRQGVSLRDRHGFTLLELIVVLFVISIVMALALPSFTDLGERKLKSEVREMASLLRYMNDSAIARKETYFIRFDIDKGMVSWTGPDGKRGKSFDDINGVSTQATGRVSKGEITFFFEPLGTRENISVHMSDGSNEMSVTLHHLSGRVKIT
jgi:prepilin-type N-terminal cleavage/methylation domain-containing protein